MADAHPPPLTPPLCPVMSPGTSSSCSVHTGGLDTALRALFSLYKRPSNSEFNHTDTFEGIFSYTWANFGYMSIGNTRFHFIFVVHHGDGSSSKCPNRSVDLSLSSLVSGTCFSGRLCLGKPGRHAWHPGPCCAESPPSVLQSAGL